MCIKKFIKAILALLIIFTQLITSFPTSTALADSKSNSNNYLVLVEQNNDTFIAYEDIALVTAKDKLMVKAKPLAKALGFSYTNGNGKKKGCAISNGYEKNVYTRNSKTYYYYSNKSLKPKSYKADYKQSILQSYNVVHYKSLNTLVDLAYFKSSKASDYDKLGFKGVIVYYNNKSNHKNNQKVPSLNQISNIKDIYPSYNDAKLKCKHDCPLCDSTLDCDDCLLCYYYNWKTSYLKHKDMKDYWKKFNWKDFDWDDFDCGDFDWKDFDWNYLNWDDHDCDDCFICDYGDNCNDCPFCDKYSNIDKPSTNKEKITVQPVTFRNSSSNDATFLEATYTLLNSSKEITLDLSKVLDTFQYYQLPYDGIYGFGSCDRDLHIQGVNKYGTFTDVVQTSKGEFALDFPGAVSLVISGDIQNLILDFTPVKPIFISEDAKLPLGAIDWINCKDKYYRQYFVIADFMKLNMENLTLPYTLSRQIIEYDSTTIDTDYSTSFQRITVVFKGNREDMLPYNRYINFKKINPVIDHPLVTFYDNGNTVLPEHYEKDVVTMIAALFSNGYNIYYPSKNWEGKVMMILNDGKENVQYDH